VFRSAQRVVSDVDRRFRFERLVLSISTHFINLAPGQIDSGIEAALRQIGEFCAVDRAYVFRFAGSLMSNTHEWCAPGVEPQLVNLQQLPLAVFPWWVARIERNEVVHIPRVLDLADEAGAEREILREQDIVSVVAVPMVIGSRALGFIGFDSIHDGKLWEDDDIALLRVTGEIVLNALERKRADEERQALEEQLVQSRSMENVARLAGGVAHDFNNLLSVILNHARAIERAVSDPRLRGYARTLCQSAEQAAELTRQLMIVGRRELLQSEVLDLNQVLGSLENLLRRTLGEAVRYDVSSAEIPCTVKLGKAHLKQVIVNLVMNAHDALPKGGHVRVETALLEDPGGQTQWIQLRVSDDGVGMSDEVARRALEPFFTTKGSAGTGLGLSTVHAIVRQAGGRVSIQSRPGTGTTVDVLLPRVSAPVAPPAPSPDDAQATRGKGESILLVEDSEPLRAWLEQTLTENGYQVLVAEDPAAALALLDGRAAMVDLLLTDVILPGISGRELAARVRQQCAQVRVAYISGYDDEVLVRQGVVDPEIALLPKPFLAEDLLAFVWRVLETGAAHGTP
jgi:two-component system cell cycle sensor histidine kinase/response regulator CckA